MRLRRLVVDAEEASCCLPMDRQKRVSAILELSTWRGLGVAHVLQLPQRMLYQVCWSDAPKCSVLEGPT